MSVLVMVRHGQSLWNLENRFTGSVDVPLTEKGVLEAKQAGDLLCDYTFDVAYCSFLTRAVMTLETMVRSMDVTVPVIRMKDFNERSYGELEGLKKDVVRGKYGPEVYRLWHRGYDIAPPGGESLKQASVRVLGAYRRTVAEDLAAGKNVLLVAHGNVLRVLMMHLDDIDAAAVGRLEIPTAEPIAYHFDAWQQVTDKKVLKKEKMEKKWGQTPFFCMDHNLNFLTCIARDILAGCLGLAHSGIGRRTNPHDVIRGGRGDIALAVSPQAGHGRPARMSESHAGTSCGLRAQPRISD